jgi:transcription antitermination factor NusG
MLASLSPSPKLARVEHIPGLWCALSTWGNREFAVAEALTANGIEHFLPYTEVRRIYRKAKVTAKVPALPGYVFAAVPPEGDSYDADALWELSRVKGVSGVIRVPAWQREQLAGELANMEEWTERARRSFETFEGDTFQPGVEVRVVSGQYEGLRGVVIRRRDRDILQVGVTLLGDCLVRDLDELEVEPL